MLPVYLICAGLAVLFLLAVFCGWAVEHVAFGKRCEGNSLLRYFTADDFPNLDAEAVSFQTTHNRTLRGYLYKEHGRTAFRGVLIFVHGMGGGHLSYTTELHTLAKNGYLVLGYDNSGTMQSDGKSLVGAPQAVRDLQAAVRFVKQDARLNAYPLGLVGHSWGGYTVCRTVGLLQDIRCVVAFSAPDDIPVLLCEQAKLQTGKSIRFLLPCIKLYEGLRFGWRATKTTGQLLQTTDVPVLLFQGDKDPVVPLENAAASSVYITKKDNIHAVICRGKQHNVYATKEAEGYITDIFQKLGVLSKSPQADEQALQAFAASMDFYKMCEEDPAVMQSALDFLDRHMQ